MFIGCKKLHHFEIEDVLCMIIKSLEIFSIFDLCKMLYKLCMNGFTHLMNLCLQSFALFKHVVSFITEVSRNKIRDPLAIALKISCYFILTPEILKKSAECHLQIRFHSMKGPKKNLCPPRSPESPVIPYMSAL